MTSDTRASGRLPLAGVRVTDMTGSYAGPTATKYLADMGASVIKVEPPSGDDCRQWGPPFVGDESAWFLSVNGGKKSIALDLKTSDGRDVLDRLLAGSDVLIANALPPTLEKLGVSEARIREDFPHLIYCIVSGFGLTGPSAGRPGYDLIAQAQSGLMSVTGSQPDDPQRVSTALSDITTGIVAAFAIASKLVEHQRTGTGGVIDVSLLGTDLALLAPRLASYLAGEPEPVPCGATDSVVAIYQRFDAADRPIVIGLGNDRVWRSFCELAGLDELLERPELASNAGRRAHRDELARTIGEAIGTRSAAEWLEGCEAAGVPASEVRRFGEVVADPQVEAMQAVRTYETATGDPFQAISSPWRLDGVVGLDGQDAAPPSLGEHSEEVLAGLGYTEAEIAEMDERGIIGARAAAGRT